MPLQIEDELEYLDKAKPGDPKVCARHMPVMLLAHLK